MIKKDIEFEDFDGVKQTESWYFHLSKSELIEMQMQLGYDLGTNDEGALQKKLAEISKEGNPRVIMSFFKDMLRRSVGVRSEDGKRFVKTDMLADAFMQTNAYDAFFYELVTNAKSAAEFINGLVPKEIGEKVDTSALQQAAAETQAPEKPAEKPLEAYTREELVALPQSEFDRLVGTDPTKMSKEHLVVAMSRRARGEHGQ